MAATRGTGGGGAATGAALAAMVMALGGVLLLAVGPTEACGGKRYRPYPTPPPPSGKPYHPYPTPPAPSGPYPTPPPPTPPPPSGKCPVDELKLAVCADVLGVGLATSLLGRGSTSTKPCCELVRGLADLDAAVCLCAAVKASVLGVVDVDLRVHVSLLVNQCGKKLPAGFQCPS